MVESAKDIWAEITKKVIESLKAGMIPSRKPWLSSPNCGSPTNGASGKAYHGINAAALLPIDQMEHGFTPKW